MSKRTPTPPQVAQALRDCATALDKHGTKAVHTAPVLASRGYAGGSGDGSGVPSSDTSDPTQRAVERGHDEWTGIDVKLTRWLSVAYTIATAGIFLLSRITGHADPSSSDRPVRRSGSGCCGACGRDVPGNANDRLRSGWCSGCLRAWERADRPDRMSFERARYAEKNPPSMVPQPLLRST